MAKFTRTDFSDVSEWLSLAAAAGYNASSLAQLCRLSPRQLQRYCIRRFGRSTQDWLDEQRMVAARYSLGEECSVKAVSIEMGFKQVSHFCRKFKETYKMTPSEFLWQTLRLGKMSAPKFCLNEDPSVWG